MDRSVSIDEEPLNHSRLIRRKWLTITPLIKQTIGASGSLERLPFADSEDDLVTVEWNQIERTPFVRLLPNQMALYRWNRTHITSRLKKLKLHTDLPQQHITSDHHGH